MAKKTWVKPMTLVQKFEANETVAAANCWAVACESEASYNHNDHPPFDPVGKWDGNESTNWIWFEHGGWCADAKNNVFQELDDGTIKFITEVGSGIDGGSFQTLIDNDGDKKISQGDYITWSTTKKSSPLITRRWNHWGTVVNTFPGRPNHS